ncbi:MAG TPA: DegT/DnrJ/EryC1/StrS family aminotransferase [Anaerolineales bacterium]|nr:DegT/DnrJ/EryC1/StrS family aminotransferase [Anaerolineales bacterium]
MYQIPLFDLNYDEREEIAVLETLRSRWISMGEQCLRLEEEFAAALDVPHGLSVANCTVGLHMALRALNIGPGDEVLVPALTFVATANAILYVGATPVFCDIRSQDDLTIDPEQIASRITSHTKAIVVMHYGGFPCDMDAVMRLADKHHLKVIEDACHGPLSDHSGGKKLGSIGDIGCFSFFSNKNISTGEGGLIVTSDSVLAQRLKLLRSHGMTTMSYERAKGHSTKYDVAELGYNYRLDDIRASLARVQLQKLPQDLAQRARVRGWYLELLHGLDGIVVPFANHQTYSSNYIFPIVLLDADADKRERVRDILHSRGVQTSVHYPAVHRFSIYQEHASRLPVTEYVADCEITLPMFAKLTREQVEYIVDSLRFALVQR